MRRLIALTVLPVLSSCTAPLPHDNRPATHPPIQQTTTRPTPPAPPPSPAHSAAAPRYRSITLSSITLRLVAFDSRTHRLELADQPAGPGSRWPDSRAAGRSLSGLAAINGGFFTPDGDPLGLVITAGDRRGSWNRSSSLGSGCYLERRGSPPQLARREDVTPSDPTLTTLLQSGPLLVENGRAVGGLRADNPRPRSLLAWDGGRRWIIATTSPCSLADLAAALAGSSPAGWPVRHALNLDGGRSSELWVAGPVSGGPAFHRPLFNKPVRNFLVLKAR